MPKNDDKIENDYNVTFKGTEKKLMHIPIKENSSSSDYWRTLSSAVGEVIQSQGSVDAFIGNQRLLIDFGINEQFSGNVTQTQEKIERSGIAYPYFELSFFSTWLLKTFNLLNEVSRKDLMEREITLKECECARIDKQIVSLQEARKSILETGFVTLSPGARKKQCDLFEETDLMLQKSIEVKRSILKGVFLTLPQRREHAGREQLLQAQLNKIEAIISNLKENDVCKEIEAIQKEICSNFEQFCVIQEEIVKKKGEIAEIEKRQTTNSTVDLENRLNEQLFYIRDLLKLTAHRMHLQSNSILTAEDNFFTCTILKECLNKIFEFDPRLFNNSRVKMFGKPSLLVVPGNGYAMYDWKGNQILVPLIVPDGNFMGSLAAAIIEYRMDVDEDKLLLGSYAKIPDYQQVRSLYKLKQCLVKDYLAWMTSETRGYRVHTKGVRQWFDHEIAPAKFDIYTPPELQSFALTNQEFKELNESAEKRVADSDENADKQDLWVAGVYNFQQGNYARSYELFSRLRTERELYPFASYNRAQSALKAKLKNEAIEAFDEFVKLLPQSWWATVAMQHLRQLRG